jgi:hypothetical protein
VTAPLIAVTWYCIETLSTRPLCVVGVGNRPPLLELLLLELLLLELLVPGPPGSEPTGRRARIVDLIVTVYGPAPNDRVLARSYASLGPGRRRAGSANAPSEPTGPAQSRLDGASKNGRAMACSPAVWVRTIVKTMLTGASCVQMCG